MLYHLFTALTLASYANEWNKKTKTRNINLIVSESKLKRGSKMRRKLQVGANKSNGICVLFHAYNKREKEETWMVIIIK
jgi:hypothetical protein